MGKRLAGLVHVLERALFFSFLRHRGFACSKERDHGDAKFSYSLIAQSMRHACHADLHYVHSNALVGSRVPFLDLLSMRLVVVALRDLPRSRGNCHALVCARFVPWWGRKAYLGMCAVSSAEDHRRVCCGWEGPRPSSLGQRSRRPLTRRWRALPGPPSGGM